MHVYVGIVPLYVLFDCAHWQFNENDEILETFCYSIVCRSSEKKEENLDMDDCGCVPQRTKREKSVRCWDTPFQLFVKSI